MNQRSCLAPLGQRETLSASPYFHCLFPPLNLIPGTEYKDSITDKPTELTKHLFSWNLYVMV